MKRAIIKPENCKNCSECAVIIICERDAIIREDAKNKPWIDFYKCSGCMKCKPACQFDAVDDIIQPCSGKARMSW